MLAVAILLPLALGPIRTHRRTLQRHWRLIVLLGLLGIAGYNTLVYVALVSTTALNALLLLSLVPAALLLSTAFLTREPVGGLQYAGVAISLAGAVTLVAHGDPGNVLALRVGAGEAWMLLGVLLWTAYSLALRRLPPELPAMATLTCSALAALLAMLAAAILLPGASLSFRLNGASLGAIGFTAVFPSVLAFLLWTRGVAELGAARSGIYLHLMPVFGAVLGVLLLAESVQAYQLAGGALVFAGLFLSEKGSPR